MVNKFSLEYDKGRFRKWLHFDGVDDYVDCGNDASLQGIKTVIALFYAQQQSERFATIVAKAGWTGTSIQGWIMRYIGTNFVFQVGDGTITRNTEVSDLAEGIHLATGIIDDDNNQIRLYIDRELRKTNELYFSERDINVTLGYSTGLNSPDSYYEGNIYFVALYNRALSDEEIKKFYLYAKYGVGKMIKDGLVLWLDGSSIDIENQVWKDKSGNGNDGTIYGVTLQSGWVEG